MATQLVDFTLGRTVSSDVTIEAGATQTLQGVFKGKRGRVTVEIKDSDNSYTTIGYLSPFPTDLRSRQLAGPLTVRVITRNAGCDLGA